MKNLARAIVAAWGVRLACAVALALAQIATASAHDARPLVLDIAEQPDGSYRARLRAPQSIVLANQPHVVWPPDCAAERIARADLYRSAESLHLLTCETPVEGRAVRVVYPLYNPSLSTIARFVPAVGEPRIAVLAPDTAEWVVPEERERLQVAADYLRLGVAHIWAGVDHLLFVVGLLLLARTFRRIVLVITGFTVAHSVTLSLSALGFVQLAVPPIEAAIALSIVFLAAEIARPSRDTLGSRYPLLISSSFGLLHGLGFAAALGEVGLPPGEATTALLFFNLGVEAGQIAFIAPFIALPWAWRRVLAETGAAVPAVEPAAMGAAVPAVGAVAMGLARSAEAAADAAVRAVPYGIGAVAGFWVIERIVAF